MSEHVEKLRFQFSSYWRIGSGKGADAIADALILRDSAGLPMVPGKTIKGLLRDAMALATLSGSVGEGRVERWFGVRLAGFDQNITDGDRQERALEKGRFTELEAQGKLWFGSARLPKEWCDWAKQVKEDGKDAGRDIIGALTTFQSSTAITENGVAEEHSLRVSEVAVPMNLFAEVRGPQDDLGWVKDLEVALPLLRALGSRRSRGFGRVRVEIISLEEAVR